MNLLKNVTTEKRKLKLESNAEKEVKEDQESWKRRTRSLSARVAFFLFFKGKIKFYCTLLKRFFSEQYNT